MFDWSLAAELPAGQRLMIAGGLTAANVGAAIARAHPWGVDAVSGIEREPGRKDPIKMREFIAAARAAGAELETARARTRTAARCTTGRTSRERAGRRAARRRRCGCGRRTAGGVGQPALRAERPAGSAWAIPARRPLRRFGGRYVPESLVPACQELEAAFRAAWSDGEFRARYAGLLRDYAGRPTPVTECARLSEELGVRVLLKREDLTHTGSHKINNVLGQGLLTVEMGKPRLVAETGAGQHGVATATAAALFGLECVVYMGEVDTERQALNVFRMRLLGAEVRPVTLGQPHAQGRRQRSPARLGGHRGDHPLLPGLGDGAAPLPLDGARVPAGDRRGGPGAVPGPARRPRPRPGGGVRRRRIQRGRHLRRLRRRPRPGWSGWKRPAGRPSAGACPACCTACTRTCSRTSGARSSRRSPSRPAWTIPGSVPSTPTCPIRAGPSYYTATDAEVLDALQLLSRTEGIIPALEPAHALAWLVGAVRSGAVAAGATVLITLSGRGDKDAEQVMRVLG